MDSDTLLIIAFASITVFILGVITVYYSGKKDGETELRQHIEEEKSKDPKEIALQKKRTHLENKRLESTYEYHDINYCDYLCDNCRARHESILIPKGTSFRDCKLICYRCGCYVFGGGSVGNRTK